MSGLNEMNTYVSLAGRSQASTNAEMLARKLEQGDRSSVRQAAEQFESYFVETMLREMRKTVPKMGESGGQAMEIFEGLFDQEISKQVSRGPGMGLADMIEKSLLSSLEGRYSQPGQMERLEMGHSISSLMSMGRVTSEFGHRNDPITGAHKHHDGLDIAMVEGTPLRPLRAGTITFSGKKGGYGNVVIVDHGGGFESVYAHLKDSAVNVGDRVTAAQVIGHSGNSGRSTGPHLHLEVREHGHAVDPAQFLP